MRNVSNAVVSCLVLALPAAPAAAAPVVPGLAHEHPLTEPEVGRLLIGELKCLACHGWKDAPAPLERSAPDLAEVGSRVSPDYLRRFLAAPAAAHPGTTMPDLLAAEPAEQREDIAESLAHFLVARSKQPFESQPVDEKDVVAGKALFHTVGCVACHSPRDDNGRAVTHDGVVDLDHLPGKYSLGSLSDFLYQPARVRPSGRMPDMKLNPNEAKAVASYLIGVGEPKAAPLKPDEKKVARGREHFQRLNCAACHTLGDTPAAKLVEDLGSADAARGCLAEKPQAAPRFDLSEGQRAAIRAALADKAEPVADKVQLAATLTAFNCIACHTREKFGGVREEVRPYFTTTEKELGDDGRIPPPLTLVGAKLRPVALKKVLFDGDGVRPYMATRMPQYGEPNLRHLPALFAKLDHVPPVEYDLPPTEGGSAEERAREKEFRAGGRELVGDKGLNCIACHTFKGNAAAKAGIDLLTFADRIEPEWYYRFLLNPAAFRPGIVMPTAWPDGKALHDTILGGDTDRQIWAVWYYLSLGQTAPDPSGLRPVDTTLTVTDTPHTYRGRSSVAGYRGIAVGFPEKLNYAFNAETGTLSAVWAGGYVRVNRTGQGSGQFQPAARFVQLAQDLSLYALKNDDEAWPLRPVTTKEAPENPDPLYPKNRGYKFLGYAMDDGGVPTFLYRTGEVAVEDRSLAVTDKGVSRLERTLTFDSPAATTVWFRALTGPVEKTKDGAYQTPALRLTVPAAPILLRPTVSDPKGSELLLRFDLPKGKSTRTFTYELR